MLLCKTEASDASQLLSCSMLLGKQKLLFAFVKQKVYFELSHTQFFLKKMNRA